MINFTRKPYYDYADLLEIIRLLRSEDGCPWDKAQTHKSIRRGLLEEAYEAAEAIDNDDPVLLKEELGDVLMQVVFHADIESDAGRFTMDDVCDGVVKKLLFRHPHVFGDGHEDSPESVLVSWEQLKRREKGQNTVADSMDSVARSLPSLWRAEKLQKKAAAAREKTSLLKIPVVQRMLLCAGVVQLTILLQQPVMPMYIGELQGSMDRIVFVTGIVFSVVGVSGVIASPLWGVIGQKWGYRPALYTALAGTACFGMIQAIPDTLVPFAVWRFIGGLTFAGIFPAINAVLTMSTPPEDRGRIFGLSYAAQQVGSVIGPLVGGGMAMYLPLKSVIFLGGFILLPLVIFLWYMRPKNEENSHGSPAQLR